METHRESLARLVLPAQRSDRSHSALMRLCSSPRSGRRRGKRASSTRLDELGTGRKWKRKPFPSIADKAGRRAAYSCPQPLAAPAQGPSHQGLSRGSHLRGRQGPVAWPAVGEGSRIVSGTEGRRGDQWGSIDLHLSPHLTQSGMDMRPGRGRRRRGGLSCCGGQGELALSDAWRVLILLEMIMS